jgi:hypothetical protein
MKRNLFLLIIGLMCGLAFAEIGLRVLNYPYIGCRKIIGVTESKTGMFDPVLGWRYMPSKSTVVDGVTYTFNRERYRVGDIQDETDPSKPIIMIVGDSTLFGDGLDFPDTFGYKLEQATKGRYQVLNFSVQGYGLDQIYLHLKQLVPMYKPKYVILDLIEDQDYRDAITDRRLLFPCFTTSGTKPLFSLVAHNTLVQIRTPETFQIYDTPRLRLVWRRMEDAFREDYSDKQALSKVLYQHIRQYLGQQQTKLLQVNYQLDERSYQLDTLHPDDSPMVASYSADYTFPDGFHPNAKGMTRLVEDFLAKFASQIQ